MAQIDEENVVKLTFEHFQLGKGLNSDINTYLLFYFISAFAILGFGIVISTVFFGFEQIKRLK